MRFKISKRNRSLLIGIACGLLCAICVGLYIAAVDERVNAAQVEMLAKYGGDQIDVCVARRDIAAGETIRDSDIEVRTWIATLLPADAVTSKSDAIGKKVGSTVLAGEVISEARFGFESADIEIPDGLVAVSVPSREVNAVGGQVQTGMIVDVYAVGSSTTRLASNIQVLATSIKSDSSLSTSSAWVTLAVRPEAVQELVSAAETLEIYFTLPSESARDKASDGESLQHEESSQESTRQGLAALEQSSQGADSAIVESHSDSQSSLFESNAGPESPAVQP